LTVGSDGSNKGGGSWRCRQRECEGRRKRSRPDRDGSRGWRGSSGRRRVGGRLHRRGRIRYLDDLWLLHPTRLALDNLIPEELLEAHPLNRVPLEQPPHKVLDLPADRLRPHAVASCIRSCRLRVPGGLVVRESDLVLASFDLLEELDVVLGFEGRLAGAHFVEDGSYGPEVGFSVVLLVAKDLGCHLFERKEHEGNFSMRQMR
jgi:hypothetical protein